MVIPRYHAEKEIKVGEIKQLLSFYAVIERGHRNQTEEKNIGQDEQRNDSLTGSGTKYHTYVV